MSISLIITKLECEFIKMGLIPTEIWLGPEQVKQLQIENDQNGWMFINGKPIQIEDGKCQFQGKTIRFMQKDGVRLGDSIKHENTI